MHPLPDPRLLPPVDRLPILRLLHHPDPPVLRPLAHLQIARQPVLQEVRQDRPAVRPAVRLLDLPLVLLQEARLIRPVKVTALQGVLLDPPVAALQPALLGVPLTLHLGVRPPAPLDPRLTPLQEVRHLLLLLLRFQITRSVSGMALQMDPRPSM